MEKALFLLCIPAEKEDDSESANKNAKAETKGSDKIVPTGDKEALSVPGVSVDSTKNTLTELKAALPETGLADVKGTWTTGQDVTVTDACPELKEETESKGTANETSQKRANQTPTSQNVSEEEVQVQTALSRKSSLKPAAESASQKITLPGQNNSTKNEKTISLPNDLPGKTDISPGIEHPTSRKVKVVPFSNENEEPSTTDEKDMSEGSLLFSKKVIEEMLTDGFWDFGSESTQVPSETRAGVTDSGDGCTTSPDTITTNVQPKHASELSEGFVTCPSTPVLESSRSGQTDVLEDEIISAVEVQSPQTSVSNKFITVPFQENLSTMTREKPKSAGPRKGSNAAIVSTEMPSKNSEVSLHQLDMKKNLSSGILTGSTDYDLEETELIDFLPNFSLKTQVKNCLLDLGVKNVAWQKCTGDKVWQATFVENAGVRCENIMLKLAAIGVGRVTNSSISVIPVTIHTEKSSAKPQVNEKEVDDYIHFKKAEQIQEKTSAFQKSVKSRLVVQQVVNSVESNAQFTFDYLMLIILASVIAAIGLVENSSVILVASMLISPLMGPILAGTFGTVIKNNKLRNLGIRSELCGLGICLFCGFVCGLITACLEAGFVDWRSVEEWPTREMSSRGVVRGLLMGMLIALPSGAGVALSVLGGNTGSLVGVAISASLLPPAVNAGMLWSAALVASLVSPTLMTQTSAQNITDIVNGTKITRASKVETILHRSSEHGLVCPEVHQNEYVHTYSCDFATDYAILGTVSLSLTMLNIVCIFVMGIVVLKIKEVAPRTSTELDKSFFKTDIKVARDSYTTAKGPQSAVMGKKWLEEYKALRKQLGLDDVGEETEIEEAMDFQQMLQSVENSSEVKDFLSHISCPQRTMSEEIKADVRNKLAEFFKLHPEQGMEYHTLTHSAADGLANPVRRAQSAYFMQLSPLIDPHPSPFIFPPHFSPSQLHLAALPGYSPSPRLAPVAEEIVSDDGNEDVEKPARNRLRLHIPKRFFVTPLSEKKKCADEDGRETYDKLTQHAESDTQAVEKIELGQKPKLEKCLNFNLSKERPRSLNRVFMTDTDGEQDDIASSERCPLNPTKTT